MGSVPSYTKEEILKHRKINDCWIIIQNEIYDVTDFILQHPAGPQLILNNAGLESSRHYNFHSLKAQKIWKQQFIGYINN